jgi:hypothetical protein
MDYKAWMMHVETCPVLNPEVRIDEIVNMSRRIIQAEAGEEDF